MKYVFLFAIFFAMNLPADDTQTPTKPKGPFIAPVQKLVPPLLIRADNLVPKDSDKDDEGAEDDENVMLEGGVPCTKPECLGAILFSPAHDRILPKDVDLVNAALIQAAFKSYSSSPQVTELLESARDHIRNTPGRYILHRRGKKTKTFCYRAVKEALREADMVPDSFNGSAVARNGVTDLKTAGFKNMLDDKNFKSIVANRPDLAPKGSVLVYETSPPAKASIAGHIEIKTGDSGYEGYISISETSKPTYGYQIPQQRRLIGVMYRDF